MTTHLKRLLALLLALLLCVAAAAAEDLAPVEIIPAEAAFVETVSAEDAPAEAAEPEEGIVVEQGEITLSAEEPEELTPVEGVPVEPAPEEPTPVEAVPEEAAPAADVVVEADPDAAVAAPALEPEPEPVPDPDAMVSAPGDPVLAVGSLTLGAKEKAQLTLLSGALPQDVGGVLASSDAKIATVDAAGLVTGKKPGSAVITLDVGGIQSTCAVTVLPAPKKIEISAKKLSLGVGEAVALGASITPGTASAIAFTSSNGNVASVDASGVIVAVGPGKCTVTASTCNGRKAKCKVTVAAAPTYVTANVGPLTMWVGRSIGIEPILSPGSGGSVACVSSNPGVVSVEGFTARALAQGEAVITLYTYNGLRADIPVTVSRVPVYRALVIGESTFPGAGLEDLPARKDVALMVRMLSSVRGPADTGWAVQSATDLTADQIHAAIQSAFAGAVDGDVSLFYISSHGDQEFDINGRYSGYAGCLMTYPDPRYDNWYDRNALTLGRLAGWLCEVPGQVVVMIDSCGSGAAIYGAAGVSAPAISAEDFDGVNVIDAPAFSPEAFDQAVIDAFRDADKGVLGPGQGAFVLENKFFVLTASAYREMGWSIKSKYSFFTKWLTDGIKVKGKMPADANKNTYATLGEVFDYIRRRAEKKVFKYKGVKYRQHVQVYPANSGFELFHR